MTTPTKPVEQKARELLANALATKFGLEPAWVAEEMETDPAEWQEASIEAIIAALNTDEERIRREAFEEAAKVCEQQAQDFLSPEYAVPQPVGSMTERFACKECAAAIRSLSTPSKGVGQ